MKGFLLDTNAWIALAKSVEAYCKACRDQTITE